MISEFIENYKELGVAGVAILTFAWYLYHQTKASSKREDKRDERQAIREDKVLDMLAVSMKNLEIHSVKNKELNKKIANIQKETLEALKKHRTESKEANEILTGVMKNVLQLSNGGNPVVKKLTDDVNKIFKILKKE